GMVGAAEGLGVGAGAMEAFHQATPAPTATAVEPTAATRLMGRLRRGRSDMVTKPPEAVQTQGP
ncbi:hypothetical protein AMR42_18510, partial [Limnothrix sp. PR1529]